LRSFDLSACRRGRTMAPARPIGVKTPPAPPRRG
jgi:hypothetical protein